MKQLATLLILFSFSVMAVFGFAMMTHAMAGDTGIGCFAGLVGGEDCPLGGTDIAIHHIAAFQIFSSSPIPAGIGSLLLVGLSLLFVAWFSRVPPFRTQSRLVARERQDHLRNYFSAIDVFVQWLSLLEFSPAI